MFSPADVAQARVVIETRYDVDPFMPCLLGCTPCAYEASFSDEKKKKIKRVRNKLNITSNMSDAVVLFGDSLFQEGGDELCERVSNETGGRICVNAGMGLETWVSALFWVRWICSSRPSTVVMMFGTNDLYHLPTGSGQAAVGTNMRFMVQYVHSCIANVKIIVMALPEAPFSIFGEGVARLNDIYRDEIYGRLHQASFCDVNPVWLANYSAYMRDTLGHIRPGEAYAMTGAAVARCILESEALPVEEPPPEGCPFRGPTQHPRHRPTHTGP